MAEHQRQASVSQRRDQRDGAFDWSRVAPSDEPSRHPGFWLGVLFAIAFGTPWWQSDALAQRLVLGLPLWVISSLTGAALLALLTCFAALAWWSDEDEEADIAAARLDAPDDAETAPEQGTRR